MGIIVCVCVCLIPYWIGHLCAAAKGVAVLRLLGLTPSEWLMIYTMCLVFCHQRRSSRSTAAASPRGRRVLVKQAFAISRVVAQLEHSAAIWNNYTEVQVIQYVLHIQHYESQTNKWLKNSARFPCIVSNKQQEYAWQYNVKIYIHIHI